MLPARFFFHESVYLSARLQAIILSFISKNIFYLAYKYIKGKSILLKRGDSYQKQRCENTETVPIEMMAGDKLP